jgi:cardiolipin synthase
LFIIDDVVYAGSANLDARSLRINYEVLLRLASRDLAEEARAIFAADVPHCRRIDLVKWRRSRSFLTRLWERWAYFLLARLDPFLARRNWQGQP